MYCTHCGNFMPDDSRFCTECGQAVYTNTPSQQTWNGSGTTAAGMSVPPSPATNAPNIPAPNGSTFTNVTQSPTNQIPTPQAAAAAGVPAVAVPPTVASKPLSPKQKRNIIIAAVAIAVMILLGIVYSQLNSSVFSPDHTVQQYMNAIADGDFDKANKIADPQVSGPQAVLLTQKASQNNGTITNQRIKSSNKNPDGSMNIDVTYSLGGHNYDKTLTVARFGHKYLFFNKWTISTPLISSLTISVPDSVDSLKINGVSVSEKNTSFDNGNRSTDTTKNYSFKAYPGKYTVKGPTSDYLSSETLHMQTAATDNGTSDDSSMSLTVEPTEKLSNAINDAIKKKIDGCAASKQAKPEGCPFSKSFYDEDSSRNFAWSVVSYPTVDDDNISIEDGTFHTTYFSGKVKLTYDAKNYKDSWEPQNSTMTMSSISGTFSISGNNVKIDLDKSDED
jgi:hypothetical protein